MVEGGGSEEYIALGPWVGSTKGDSFDYRPQGIITQIVIAYRDDRVDSITFKSKTDDGSISSSPTFGVTVSGSKTYTVSFSPGEYIIRLNIGLLSTEYVSYLLISTNTRVYGPFGSCTGTEVSIPITDGYVVGFFGRCGSYIYSLGFYVSKATFIEANKKVSMVQDGSEEYVALGPWVGNSTRGKPFDYRPQGIITQIVIAYRDDCVDSITFMNKTRDGSVSSSPNFGTKISASKIYTVSFAPGEYIIRLNIGLLSDQYVSYLLISTNMRVYGPFGSCTGTEVSIPITDGYVVGFFGRCGTYINSLGFYVSKAVFTKANKVLKSWTYLPQGLVKTILIAHGDVINSLVFESITNDGVLTSSMRFGGPGGTTTEVPISVGEYISGIDMMIGDYSGQKVINLLTIHTNVKTYGPFGKARGSKTNIFIKKGSVVGFYGCAGKFLNTIGIFEVVQPDHEDKAVKSWTYLPQGLLTKILISYGNVIDSLIFESKTSDGVVTSSMRFGGIGGTTAEVPISVGEYITGIDIMTGDYSEQKVINLLTIHTNLKTYGPFGKGPGSETKICIKKGTVVGFSGLAGIYLNTLGIFEVVQPISSDQNNEDDMTDLKPNKTVEKTVGPCEKGSSGSDITIDDILLDIDINLELSSED